MRDTSFMDEPIESRGSRRMVWILSLVAGALGLLAFLPLLSKWSAAEDSVELDRLRLATVSRGELVHAVAVQGRVVAASRPTLFSPATGIVELAVREGETVVKGEVLATVDSPQLESQLRQERASLEALGSDFSRLQLAVRQQNQQNAQNVERLRVGVEAARRSVARNQKLTDLGLVNDIELEEANDGLTLRSLELAQAERKVALDQEMLVFELSDAEQRRGRQLLVVEEAERRVAELAILSPFDGMVATVEVEDRDAVAAGQAIVGVVDLGDLEVEVEIPESYADDLQPGLAAEITVDGERHGATLVRLAPEVRNSQVQGRLAFAERVPDGLRQNQRLSTRLIIDQRDDTLKVRRGPFIEGGGGRHVYVMADGLARRRAIEIGAVSIDEVEILSGLEVGDHIILSDLSRYQGADTLLIRD